MKASEVLVQKTGAPKPTVELPGRLAFLLPLFPPPAMHTTCVPCCSTGLLLVSAVKAAKAVLARVGADLNLGDEKLKPLCRCPIDILLQGDFQTCDSGWCAAVFLHNPVMHPRRFPMSVHSKMHRACTTSHHQGGPVDWADSGFAVHRGLA
jgi:hypothetical protein